MFAYQRAIFGLTPGGNPSTIGFDGTSKLFKMTNSLSESFLLCSAIEGLP